MPVSEGGSVTNLGTALGMYHYYNAITNTRGDSLPGYFVRAVNTTDNTVSPIYSDDSSTPISVVSGVANMALTDSDGNVSFYIASGTYHVDIYAGDQTTFVKRVPSVPMTLANVADALGSGTSTAPSQRAVSDALATKANAADYTATTGAALVGASDGASGALWTTVAGFITKLLSSAGSSVIGFVLNATGAVSRTVRDKLADTGHWKDFGIVADGSTDDTAAVQAAFDWLAPGRTLLMPGGDVKITSTLNLGNGTTTALSTKANNSVIIWGGDVGEFNFLTKDGTDPWTAVGKAGTRFVWAGANGGTMMKWNGPIQGVRMIGAVVLDCNDPYGSGVGASYGLDARSFTGFTVDAVGAVNWKAGGRGILLTTQQVATIGGNSNPPLSGNNDFGRLFAYSPNASGGECIRLDGYRATGGQDVTVSRFRFIGCGFSGNNAKGLVLGYTDNCHVDHAILIMYGSSTGAPSPLHLDGTSIPFEAPSQFRLGLVSVSGAVAPTGTTNGNVTISQYNLDDGGLLPSGVTGLHIERIDKSGAPYNGLIYNAFPLLRTRALGDGEGFAGQALDGGLVFSMERRGSGVRYTSAGNMELEPVGKLVSVGLKGSPSYVNDTAAASGGVPLGGFYRNGSNLQIRVS